MNPFQPDAHAAGPDLFGRNELVDSIVRRVRAGGKCRITGLPGSGKSSVALAAAGETGKRFFYVDLTAPVISPFDIGLRFARGMLASLKNAGYRKVSDLMALFHGSFETGEEGGYRFDPVKLTEKPSPIDEAMTMYADVFEGIGVVDNPDSLQALQGRCNANESYHHFLRKEGMPIITVETSMDPKPGIFRRTGTADFGDGFSVYEVQPLPEKPFMQFLTGKFLIGGRTVPESLIREVVHELVYPGPVIRLCSALWDLTDEGSRIDDSVIGEAIDLIISRREPIYRHILGQITCLQMRVLLTLIRSEGRKTTSATFLEHCGVGTGGAVHSSLKSMSSMQIVRQDEEKRWHFADPFFANWLAKHYLSTI